MLCTADVGVEEVVHGAHSVIEEVCADGETSLVAAVVEEIEEEEIEEQSPAGVETVLSALGAAGDG